LSPNQGFTTQEIDEFNDDKIIQILLDDSPDKYLNLSSWENYGLFSILLDHWDRRIHKIKSELAELKFHRRKHNERYRIFKEVLDEISQIPRESIKSLKRKQKSLNEFNVVK
jgi:hypothetical protein